MQTADAHWLAPLVSQAEMRLEPGRVTARVEAAITEAGTLQGTVTIEGDMSRRAVSKGGSHIPSILERT